MVLIKTAGLIGVSLIVFAESGFFIGFFLPGDSLLFTAGFLASQQLLNIWLLIPICLIAAYLGDSFGYAFGKKAGPRIFKKEDSVFFNKKNVTYAQSFYEEYGKKTIIFARFLPIVRTFAPILAGVGRMRYGTFLVYNIIGGTLWVLALSLLGFTLGRVIPNIDHYLLPIIGLIIVVSLIPTIIHVFKAWRKKRS